jgi:hypothetical protein
MPNNFNREKTRSHEISLSFDPIQDWEEVNLPRPRQTRLDSGYYNLSEWRYMIRSPFSTFKTSLKINRFGWVYIRKISQKY